MYLPVPVSGPGDDSQGPSTRDRAASIRSRRAAASDRNALRPSTSRPSSNLHGSRRSHRKVRTGCTNCKERKIKCDEAKPSCWQCTRHNVPCDFSKSRPTSVSGASPPASESSVNASLSPMVSPALRTDGSLPGNSDIAVEDTSTGIGATNSNGNVQSEILDTSASAAFAFLEWSFNFNKDDSAIGVHSTPTQMSYDAARDTLFAAPTMAPRAPVTCASALDGSALNMTDLFLLHHFSTVTARSLCPWHAEVQQWWTHEVPRVAVRHPFVMRSLLTVAGLHVAYLADSGDSGDNFGQSADVTGSPSFHIARAIEQHKLAGQTAASMLPTLDRATSAPMYVFSVLTQIISMAMPWPQKDPSIPVTWDSIGVHEWIRLLRGVRTISDLGQEWGVDGDAFLGGRNEGTMPRQLYREQFLNRARASSDVRDAGGSNSEKPPERRSRWHVMHEPPLATLRELITADIGGIEMESEEKDEMRNICLGELDQLVSVFTSFLDNGESIQTSLRIMPFYCTGLIARGGWKAGGSE